MAAHLCGISDRRKMGKDLRQQEPRLTAGVPGDVSAVCLLFRYLAWRATHGRILPDYCDLPTRLMQTANEAQFEILYDRVEKAASAHDSISLTLGAIRRVKFLLDDEMERARREKIYARYWDKLLKRAGRDIGKSFSQGPAARAVELVSIGDLFNPEKVERYRSARALAIANGINRSDVRTAIRRGHRLLGCNKVRYADEPAAIVLNGLERPMRSRTTGKEYPSQTAAAEAMGVSQSMFAHLFNAGEEINGQQFEYVKVSAPTDAPKMRVAKSNEPCQRRRAPSMRIRQTDNTPALFDLQKAA